MLAASFAELFSIGMVIPFLGVLTSPEIIFDHRFAKPIIKLFGINSHSELVLSIFLLFLVAVVFAASIRLLLVFLQARISLGIVNELATNAYHRTLCQPYAIHISRNSSEVISGILNKVNGGIGGLLGGALTFLSSQITLVAIVGTLFIVNPILALSLILGFGVIYALVILLTKKQLARDSERINQASTEVIKVLQEGLGGIRDVLLDGSQSTYTATFRQADIKLKNAQANIQILSVGPRYVIEAIGIFVIALVAYLLSTRVGGLITVIPLMGTLALGAQKTLPLLQQSYSSWAQIQGSRESLRDALAFLDQPIHQNKLATDPAASIRFEHDIRLDSASFQYNPQAARVLKDLSLSIPKGAKVGFIGETGSGKSTLIDIIMGLLLPTDGYLMVDGQKINADNYQSWQKHIAHVPQTIFLSDASIAENIAIGLPRDKIDMSRVQLAAQRSRIADTIEAWPKQYDTAVGERGVKLSGGQRQRIGIARALYKQADVIILDEATSALDNDTEQAVMQAIDGLGDDLTILIVAHRLTTLRNCSQIVELQSGELKRIGSYADIVETSPGPLANLAVKMRPALFLDRDGVINVDHGYVHRPEEFDFMDGIFDVARAARDQGYRLVVVTNQAGIGRGHYSEMQFHQLTDWMCQRFSEERAPIDGVYFSPYHPTAGLGEYQQDHVSRKPRPGMLLRAQRELVLDLSASILIGDKQSDIQAGIAAGIRRNLLLRAEDCDVSVDAGYLRIGKLRDALPFLADSELWRS